MSSEFPKLYHSSGSPNSRRVRIFLAEKDICLSRVPVDLGQKEQFSEAYSRINPRNVVPALVLEDGTTIGEVPAIQRYLEESYPDKPLFGTSPKEKALVAMWDRRAELEGFAAVMETVRNKVAGLAGHALAGPHAYEQIPALVDRGRKRIADFHADLEARLGDVPYVAGEAFSVADITTLVTVDFATKALDAGVPESNRATRKWYELVAGRPSSTA